MNILNKIIGVAAFSALAAAPLTAEDALAEFGDFKPADGAQFVEVNIDSNLISMAARLVKASEPEVAEVLGGLKKVRVNVLGLTDENREEVLGRIRAIRSELSERGWQKIVTARQENEDVGIFVKLRGDEAIEGVVVTAVEGDKEAVVVNVTGNIEPEKLAMIGERFDIEPLKKLKAEAEAEVN